MPSARRRLYDEQLATAADVDRLKLESSALSKGCATREGMVIALTISRCWCWGRLRDLVDDVPPHYPANRPTLHSKTVANGESKQEGRTK